MLKSLVHAFLAVNIPNLYASTVCAYDQQICLFIPGKTTNNVVLVELCQFAYLISLKTPKVNNISQSNCKNIILAPIKYI